MSNLAIAERGKPAPSTETQGRPTAGDTLPEAGLTGAEIVHPDEIVRKYQKEVSVPLCNEGWD